MSAPGNGKSDCNGCTLACRRRYVTCAFQHPHPLGDTNQAEPSRPGPGRIRLCARLEPSAGVMDIQEQLSLGTAQNKCSRFCQGMLDDVVDRLLHDPVN